MPRRHLWLFEAYAECIPLVFCCGEYLIISHLSFSQNIFKGLSNGILRALTIGSRFLLLLLLLKTASPEAIGIYGLVSASVAYVSLLIGADFYQYSQRELIAQPHSRRSFVIQHQALTASILYFALLPASLLIFSFNLLPITLIGLFYALTITEHLGQEVGRSLTALSCTVTAGVVLFLRSASWVWILAASSMFENSTTLDSILKYWLFGSLVGLVYGLIFLHKEIRPWRKWPIDLNWILRGARKSFLFFIATLAFKGMTTIDRYMMQVTSEPDVTGAYVVYVGIAMVLINLLDAVVFAPLFPSLVLARVEDRNEDFVEQYRKLHRQTWLLATIGSVLSIFLVPQVFQWADKSIYQNYLEIYYVIVAAIFLYAVSMVPHYALYAKGKDVAIVAIQIGALIPFAVTFAIAYHSGPTYGAALALFAAFLFIFSAKTLINKRCT